MDNLNVSLAYLFGMKTIHPVVLIGAVGIKLGCAKPDNPAAC